MITLDLLLDNPNHVIKEHIDHVVGYARKSRPTAKLTTEDDIEKDLQEQVGRLSRFCEINGWSYDIKIEIESGENLKDRPVINQVFNEMDEGKYDAILSTSYDRISRGSASDHESVLFCLRRNLAVIIEDNGVIYNPYNEQDLQLLQMKGNFANYEYKTINSRFTAYKRAGAKNGRWVSGSTPYGYDFDRKTRKLVINEEQGEIYRNYILKPFLDGASTSNITWDLNKKRIPSPRNGMWNKNTVIRLLKSQIHCGDIVYNMTQGSRKKNNEDSLNNIPYRKMTEDKWTIAENAHPKLKTHDEHEMVLELFDKKRPKQSLSKNYHPLSGIVKCYHCGKTMRIQRGYKDKESHFKKCECGDTRGGALSIVSKSIMVSINIFKNKLLHVKELDNISDDKRILLNEINKMEEKVDTEYNAIKRIEEAFENGAYSLNSMVEKKEKRMSIIYELEGNIRRSKARIDKFSTQSNEEKLKRIDRFINDISDESNEEALSETYKEVINNVIWRRDNEDEIAVTVNFL